MNPSVKSKKPVMPREGDVVTVTMTGEIIQASNPVEGYVWVRVKGHGPTQVPVSWTRIVKENNGHRVTHE